MKQQSKYILILVVGFIVMIGLYQSTFIVNEEEQVIITQFGKPVGDAITEPGFKFKLPFIQKANYFDKRFLEWDGDADLVPTKDKKYIFVDAYARWKIVDPLQFFKRLKNERGAQTRLDDILDGETRDFVANHNIEEVIRSNNRQPNNSDSIQIAIIDSLVHVEVGRKIIQEEIQKSANERASDLGVVILDFRFKRIDYEKDVKNEVYERMRSERQDFAAKFRSEGKGEASSINGSKEKELKQIQSEAYKIAEEIKGKADAEATAIYAKAYNSTSQARELYSFLKSMETLEKTFDSQTSVILSTDSELYKYLKSAK